MDKLFAFGAVLGPKDDRDYTIAPAAAIQAFPDEFMLPYLPNIKNQGTVGSCVAHSISYINEYYNRKSFATGFVYGFRPDGYYQGVGMIHREALKTILDYGNVLYEVYPKNIEVPTAISDVMGTTTYEGQEDNGGFKLFGYKNNAKPIWSDRLKGYMAKANPYKIVAYAKVTSIDQMKTALMAGMPLIASVSIINSYPDSKTFILKTGNTNVNLHSMAAWGWKNINGVDYFRVSNSWGDKWGDKGFCWISGKDYLAISDCWSVADETQLDTIRRTLHLTDPYMKGDDVKECQEKLIKHGANIKADGTFGTDTYNAVKEFQAAKGITADGIVGEDTWAALDKDPDPVNPPKPEPQPEPEPEPQPEPEDDEDDGSIISRFIKWLREQLGFIYVWGGNGEEMTPARIKRMENSDANYQRALALYNKKVAEGMDPVIGYDCSGLVSKFLQNEGIVTKKRNCRHLANMCVKVKELTDVSELERGDLLFRWNSKDSYYHVGVFISENEVIESKGRDYGVVEFAINAFGKDHWNRWGRLECMLEDVDNDDEEIVFGDPYFAQCSGAQVYVREGGSTAYNAIGVAKKGDIMLAVPTGGWPQIAIMLNGVLTIGYMSDKYVEKI